MTHHLPLLAQESTRLTWDQMPEIGRVLPEVFLCLWLVLILVVDLVRGRKPGGSLFPALSLVGCVIGAVLVMTSDSSGAGVGYGGFAGLAPDAVSRVFKVLFLGTGFFTVLFAWRSRAKWATEAELHVILFGALAGMCYLSCATELIGAYLAFETVSYTGFLMAGYRTDDPKSAEAGGKFVVFGAVASAVMLFGLSLLYGFTGTTQLAEMAAKLQAAGANEPILWVGGTFVFAGFAFKAAAFPMQFWCPDVYEGAPAPVAAFLAVASKAAVFSIGVRVLMIGGIGNGRGDLAHFFAPDSTIPQTILFCAAAATMTWGNFAALRQKSLQRMLAYSSIAHAGYLLMTAAVILPAGPTSATDPSIRDAAVSAILVYFVLYLLMTLGAFWVVTMMRRDAGSADISALRGAGARQPVLALCLALILISLTGLPPTAGFVGKLQLFAPVIKQGFYLLAAVGLVNGAVSLYYYAKPLREMYLVECSDADATRVRPDGADKAILAVLAVPLLILGVIGWDSLTAIALRAVGSHS